jgi:hypothetical protein
MKSLVVAFMALPFMTAAAGAAQPLSDAQMDAVAAGFSANSVADAEALAGESGVAVTTTATLAQVFPYATAHCGCEISSTLYLSVSAAQSASVTSTITPWRIPGLQ